MEPKASYVFANGNIRRYFVTVTPEHPILWMPRLEISYHLSNPSRHPAPSPAALGCPAPGEAMSATRGWPHSQHTEAVDSRDALAVSQQVAAIGARRQQQLLPSLAGDAPVVDGQRVHAGAVFCRGQLSPCTALPLAAPQLCAPLSISVSVADVNRMCSHL